MKLIVGLGNPGTKYADTRHNIGFMVVDKLAEKWGVNWETNKKVDSEFSIFNSQFSKIKEKIYILKPQTYMNKSGEAISKFIDFYKFQANTFQLYIIYDDVDLDLGRVKIQPGGGSAGGHHGLESVLQHTKDKFSDSELVKFRIGIGRPLIGDQQFDSAEEIKKSAKSSGNFCAYQGLKSWVLGKFSLQEKDVADLVVDRTVQAIQTVIEQDIQTAMNKFNGK